MRETRVRVELLTARDRFAEYKICSEEEKENGNLSAWLRRVLNAAADTDKNYREKIQEEFKTVNEKTKEGSRYDKDHPTHATFPFALPFEDKIKFQARARQSKMTLTAWCRIALYLYMLRNGWIEPRE